jgi:hypothetical protein
MKNCPEIEKTPEGYVVKINGEVEYGPTTETSCDMFIDAWWHAYDEC